MSRATLSRDPAARRRARLSAPALNERAVGWRRRVACSFVSPSRRSRARMKRSCARWRLSRRIRASRFLSSRPQCRAARRRRRRACRRQRRSARRGHQETLAALHRRRRRYRDARRRHARGRDRRRLCDVFGSSTAKRSSSASAGGRSFSTRPASLARNRSTMSRRSFRRAPTSCGSTTPSGATRAVRRRRWRRRRRGLRESADEIAKPSSSEEGRVIARR